MTAERVGGFVVSAAGGTAGRVCHGGAHGACHQGCCHRGPWGSCHQPRHTHLHRTSTMTSVRNNVQLNRSSLNWVWACNAFVQMCWSNARNVDYLWITVRNLWYDLKPLIKILKVYICLSAHWSVTCGFLHNLEHDTKLAWEPTFIDCHRL